MNRWTYHYSSNRLRWPSIHPKQRALSGASGNVTGGMPDAFLASLSQTPSDVAWCSSGHASHAAWDSKARVEWSFRAGGTT